MNKPLIVAEIGINHNGDINIAKGLIALSKSFGADYVKFQKRDINSVYSKEFLDSPRVSHWGTTQREQKEGLEFTEEEYDEINRYCLLNKISWFASVWDTKSIEFLKKYELPLIKIPSALITNKNILVNVKNSGIPVVISRGMSTKQELDEAISILGDNLKYILHTTSSYPTPNNEMNMGAITTLKNMYGGKYKIGFSNHCMDLIYIIQAYVMRAEMLEFHITLDRNLYGSDQSSSIGPTGFKRIIDHINNISIGYGDGELKVQNSEIPIIKKLRNTND